MDWKQEFNELFDEYWNTFTNAVNKGVIISNYGNILLGFKTGIDHADTFNFDFVMHCAYTYAKIEEIGRITYDALGIYWSFEDDDIFFGFMERLLKAVTETIDITDDDDIESFTDAFANAYFKENPSDKTVIERIMKKYGC